MTGARTGKGGVQARIQATEALAHEPLSPALTAQVRAALADRSALVVAAAARAAQTHRLAELVPGLLAAAGRLFHTPVASDPQCHGKIATVKALAALDHDDDAVYLRAARHIQMEPVWGGQEDSAPRLRIVAADALARIGHLHLFQVMAELLSDPSREVRAAAAKITGELGGERAGLLLRLRLRVAEDAPENRGDYAAALLTVDGAQAVPLVAGLLTIGQPGLDGIVLALGASRVPEALTPLLAFLAQPLLDQALRHDLITAIALLRSEAAGTELLRLLAGDSGADARSAAEGLHLYRERPALLEAALAIADAGSDPRLRRLLTTGQAE